MGVPRSEATGVVTPEMWDRMQDPIKVDAARPDRRAGRPHRGLPARTDDGRVPRRRAGARRPHLDRRARRRCHRVHAVVRDRRRVLRDDHGRHRPQRRIRSRSPRRRRSAVARTRRPGVFKAYRKVEGQRLGPLGGMMNPIYINQGIAIHGADNVPLQPGVARVHPGVAVPRRLDAGRSSSSGTRC